VCAISVCDKDEQRRASARTLGVEQVLHDNKVDLDLLVRLTVDNLDGVDAEDLGEERRPLGAHEVVQQQGRKVEEGVELRKAKLRRLLETMGAQ